MKIKNFKTKVIGPVLLLIPMACMHLGDDHHSGHGHFSALHPSYQHSAYKPMAGVIIAQEAVTSERDPNNH
jgi:hypothetical protein